jgi:serine protease AprX
MTDAGSSRRRVRKVTGGAALLALTASAGALVASPHSAEAATGAQQSVIVTASDGRSSAQVATAVRAAGGEVLSSYSVVHGVSARLAAGTTLPGLAISADRPLHVTSARVGATSTGVPDTLRATLGLTDSSASGAGVTVAVVDTGVADVPDLAGRVTHMSASSSPTSFWDLKDGYGHGTFMAGLIAGSGASSGQAYTGVAPAARILDVRVASADGTTALSDVLAGLSKVATWAPTLHIKVLNLSLDSGSPLPWQVDPLTEALDALWDSGITVVVPAGNGGVLGLSGTVSSPGVDPNLITVGSLDEHGTANRADDTVSAFSGRGPTFQGVGKPDVVAPGAHLISLAAASSVIYKANPDSVVDGSYFRGSGTSMSTAVTSGVIADILSVRPGLSPDGVKALLVGTAYPAAGLSDKKSAGAGGVDAALAVASAESFKDLGTDSSATPPGPAWIWDGYSNAIVNDQPISAAFYWSLMPASAKSWVTTNWQGLNPVARAWVINHWDTSAWAKSFGGVSTTDLQARYWAARSWIARSWIARSWISTSWTGQTWSAVDFTARSWIGNDWSARSWIARSWIARSWISDSWSGRSWS